MTHYKLPPTCQMRPALWTDSAACAAAIAAYPKQGHDVLGALCSAEGGAAAGALGAVRAVGALGAVRAVRMARAALGGAAGLGRGAWPRAECSSLPGARLGLNSFGPAWAVPMAWAASGWALVLLKVPAELTPELHSPHHAAFPLALSPIAYFWAFITHFLCKYLLAGFFSLPCPSYYTFMLLALSWVSYLLRGTPPELSDFLHKAMSRSQSILDTLGSQFCRITISLPLSSAWFITTENQLYIEVASLFNPIFTRPIPSNCSPHTVCPLSHIISSAFVQVFTEYVAKPGWEARDAAVWPSPKRRAKGHFFRTLLRVRADTPSGGVYYLNKQDDQKDQQKRTTVSLEPAHDQSLRNWPFMFCVTVRVRRW